MNGKTETWIAVIDAREARLLRGGLARVGRGSRVQLDVVESIENPWRELDGEEGLGGLQGNVRRVIGRRSELLARYTVDVMKWLDTLVRKRGIDELHVFASARLQSLLRAMYPPSLGQRVTDHTADFEGVDLDALTRNPDVRSLVETREAGRRAS